MLLERQRKQGLSHRYPPKLLCSLRAQLSIFKASPRVSYDGRARMCSQPKYPTNRAKCVQVAFLTWPLTFLHPNYLQCVVAVESSSTIIVFNSSIRSARPARASFNPTDLDFLLYLRALSVYISIQHGLDHELPRHKFRPVQEAKAYGPCGYLKFSVYRSIYIRCRYFRDNKF